MQSAPNHMDHEALRRVREAVCSRFDAACRFTYIVGIQTVRILHRIRGRFWAYLRPVGFLIRHLYFVSLGKYFYGIRSEIISLRDSTTAGSGEDNKAKSSGLRSVCAAFWRLLHNGPGFLCGFFRGLARVLVPTACILVLVSCVRYWTGKNFSLVLSNQGKVIGSIQNEKVYEEAAELVNQRMVHDSTGEEASVKFAPSFQLTSADSALQTSDSVCNLLIQQSNGIIEEASGLYVDGILKGAVKSPADLRYILQNHLEAARGDDKEATAHFVNNIEVVNGLYPTASIITTEKMKSYVDGTKSEGTTYTVKEGDTATSIAAANGMSLAELQKINRNLGNSIKPGDLVQIQVAEPTFPVELTKTLTYEQTIPYTTVTQKDDSKYSDYTKVLVQGVDGKQKCVDIVHTVNGVETKRESVSRTVLVQPVNKVVLTGTKKRPLNEKGVPSGKFLWPVPSLHTITSSFGTRWGEFHKGIDISGSGAYGRTIVASDGGVVSLAGWNDGYGKCVIINHRNGKKTLYGHCSSLLVSNGEAVSRGQPIAKIGSTGHSTGSHLHFEIISGGSNVNPLKYVS
jgi:murein DD-endopeptidase MepM/ murein hydrolase activator NlpD